LKKKAALATPDLVELTRQLVEKEKGENHIENS